MGRCSAAAGDAIAVGMAFAAVVVDDDDDDGNCRLLCRLPLAATPTAVRAGIDRMRGSLELRTGGAATAALAEAEPRRDAGGIAFLFFSFLLLSSTPISLPPRENCGRWLSFFFEKERGAKKETRSLFERGAFLSDSILHRRE